MLSIGELYELVKKRRSVRGYDFNEGKTIPEEYVEKILEIARWAPSAGNGQPWQFIVIKDEKMREKIVNLYLKQLARLYHPGVANLHLNQCWRGGEPFNNV